MDKQALRAEILTRLRTQKEEDRQDKSSRIWERLIQLTDFECARTVLFYASFDGEVETIAMMKRAQELGKRIALPTILSKGEPFVPFFVNNLEEDLEDGPYGIRQPKYHETACARDDLDLVIVPGVAFDRRNNRLGRGQGYYDRFLRTLPSRIVTVGLAFDFQIVATLPHQPHDIPVQHVIEG